MAKRRKTELTPKREMVVSLNAPVRSEWSGPPGNRLRRILGVISNFIHKHQLTPSAVADEAVELATDKIRGAARKDIAAATKNLVEADQIRFETEQKKRLAETAIVRAEAETSLAVTQAIDAEFELLKKLSQAGVGCIRFGNGGWKLVPLCKGADLTAAITSDLGKRQPAESDSTEDAPSTSRTSSAGI